MVDTFGRSSCGLCEITVKVSSDFFVQRLCVFQINYNKLCITKACENIAYAHH